MYIQVDKLIPKLVPEDYEKDEKQRSVTLTEQGSQHIEDLLDDSGILQGGSLYDVQNISIVHHVNQALRAHSSLAATPITSSKTVKSSSSTSSPAA